MLQNPTRHSRLCHGDVMENTQESELILRVNFTAFNKPDAELKAKKLTILLTTSLSPSVTLKTLNKPVLLFWDKDGCYQVLYLLYAGESFVTIRNKLSKNWDVYENNDVVWKGIAPQTKGQHFLGMPEIKGVHL